MMRAYAAQDLRNVCIVGAQGDGKTTLAEALLFNAAVVPRQGTVADGTTVGDAGDDEVRRKTSLHLAVAFFEHAGAKINLLTAPGYADFVGDCAAGLTVCESALLVIAADTGVTPAVVRQWEYLTERNIPVLIFVNKIDKASVTFQEFFAGLKTTLSHEIVDIDVPDATGSGFSTSIALLREPVPPEAAAFRELMIEDISAGDDVLTEEFLEGKPIPPAELRATLKKEIRERKVFPLLCGSALKNIGIRELADFIVEFLPPPAAAAGPFSGLVFKSVHEPGMGPMNLIRIWSGSVRSGVDLNNTTRHAKERIGQLAFVQGKKRIDTAEAAAGDMVAALKLHDVRTNDILVENGAASDRHIAFPAPVYHRALSAHAKADEEKLSAAMAIIAQENPTVTYQYNPETREMLLSGMGALQLEILSERIASRFGIAVDLRAPRVPYKETVRTKAEVQGKYKRQSGGRGQYGDCWLRIEPLPRGSGFMFENRIVGGAIPRNYIPAIEKGVREAMEQGVIAGYPVVDLNVTVYDGSYHEVDSSDMAFKIAGAMALRKGVAAAHPLLLEPIAAVEVVVPEDHLGAVLGDLNSRRGRVTGMDKAGKSEVVRAVVPAAALDAYAVELRSLTKGSGSFTQKHAQYDEAPHDIAQPLIEAYQKTVHHEEEK